eukprot:7948833-Alexandrium_andersonii.AAC.1
MAVHTSPCTVNNGGVQGKAAPGRERAMARSAVVHVLLPMWPWPKSNTSPSNIEQVAPARHEDQALSNAIPRLP